MQKRKLNERDAILKGIRAAFPEKFRGSGYPIVNDLGVSIDTFMEELGFARTIEETQVGSKTRNWVTYRKLGIGFYVSYRDWTGVPEDEDTVRSNYFTITIEPGFIVWEGENSGTFSLSGNDGIYTTGYFPSKLGEKKLNMIREALSDPWVDKVYRRGGKGFKLLLNGVEQRLW